MAEDPRIQVTARHLRGLRGAARGLSLLPRQPAGSALRGRHGSRLRGRGLRFEELRHYLPGDDIRAIDWLATARTDTPQLRVFSEERDRPALLVVDQRMSMFFGSQLNLKSVTAAEAAALAAYAVLDAGDRVGGIVFGDDGAVDLAPRRSRRAVHALLETIARMNATLHARRQVAATHAGLNRVLDGVARIAHHDHLVMVFSDFDGIDDSTQRRLRGIAAHNDLVLVLVYDPLAEGLQPGAAAVITDGRQQAQLDFASATTRDAVTRFSRGRLERIRRWQQSINLSVLPLSAGEPTLPQMQRLTRPGRAQRSHS